jgi:hypothetical protein
MRAAALVEAPRGARLGFVEAISVLCSSAQSNILASFHPLRTMQFGNDTIGPLTHVYLCRTEFTFLLRSTLVSDANTQASSDLSCRLENGSSLVTS